MKIPILCPNVGVKGEDENYVWLMFMEIFREALLRQKKFNEDIFQVEN